MKIWNRIKHWWTHDSAGLKIPTEAEVEHARQEWLSAERDLLRFSDELIDYYEKKSGRRQAERLH